MSDADKIVTGADYVRQITARASDRRYRRAFQLLALRLTQPAETLLDFGCGPGIDARVYAEHGRRVWAYDVDTRMCDYLAVHCRDFIASGAVTLQRGAYREFLDGPTPSGAPRVQLVTSDFAPLNLIDDLGELFARFAALTSPTGAVLASVLSPYFIGDLRYGWWWRNVGRLWRQGSFAVPGAQALIWRRRLEDFALHCSPYFSLEQVFPGSLSGGRARARGAWLPLGTCRFMFLLFRKRHPPGDNVPGSQPPALRAS